MGFADRMVRTENGALHEAETALRRIDVSKAAEPDIFVGRMVDGGVAGELFADRLIRGMFVGHQMRLAARNGDKLFAKRFRGHVGDME
jgi:hypothetical protein